MILYFSGTGNSYVVAKQISEAIKDEIKSINKLLKQDFHDEIYSDKPLIFVVPTYGWRMPRVVEEFIRKIKFKGNSKAYFILTCEAGIGNAEKYVINLCKEKNFKFKGLDFVFMPANYIALYPMSDKEKIEEILENAKIKISEIAEEIKLENELINKKASIMGKLQSGLVNYLFYKLFVKSKGFRVDDSCISCGKCIEVCSLNNISLLDGKPVWKNNCTHCMACINRCPKEAIQHKNNTKNKSRYYIDKI